MLSIVNDWLKTRQRMSRKLVILIYCFIGSLLFLLFQGGKSALMLFLIITMLSIYLALGKWSGIVAAKGKRQIIHPEFSRDMEAGTSLQIEVSIQIPGLWPIPYVIVRESLNRRNDTSTSYDMTYVPDWNRKGTVIYTVPPLRRGYYQFEETTCSTEDIFGLFEHTGTLKLEQSFRVLPRTVSIKQWKQFDQMIRGAHHHTSALRAQRETTQIDGVREYVYGDRISRIHWKTTARTGVWKSKEFERESLPKMTIVLDRHAADYENNEQFEKAVSTTASLFRFAHKEQLAFGFLSVGKEPTYFVASRGPDHQKEMMNHLIEVEADGNHSLDKVIQQYEPLIGKGVFTILVTPQHDATTMLQMLGLLSAGHIIPCHMWIAGERHVSNSPAKTLAAKGYKSYEIQTLEQLPFVLGGGL